MIVLALLSGERKNNDDRLVRGTVVAHVLKRDVVFLRANSLNTGDGNIHGNYHGELTFL